MRIPLTLLAVSLLLASAAKPAVAQPETPMQLCTPLMTENCATYPRWLRSPQFKISRTPAGSQPDEVVGLNLVVGADGSVHSVDSMKSPDDTRKQQVIASAWDWKFIPATFQGHPVPVAVRAVVQIHGIGNPNINLGPWRATWTTVAELQKIYVDVDQARARADYQKAAALSRELISLEPLYRGIRLTLGQSLLGLHQYNEAEAAVQEEMKLDPKSAFAYNLLGWIYQQHGRFEDAIAQYRKQIEITPDTFNPHANLGVLLASRKRCAEAMPELEKALSISPGQSRMVLAQGKCDIDLGNIAKGTSEMEQAADKSASSSSWNEAAYRLAEQNVELDTAERWSQKAIAIESVLLRDLSLDHATPTQMRLVNSMSNYWDTLGWIYFRMGKVERALGYADAAWRMHPTPTKGDHLGQIYEKLGRHEEAIRIYGMAVASADLSKRGPSSPEDMAEARERLTQLAGQGADVAVLIEQGHAALEALNSISLENTSKHIGSAEFTLKIAGDRVMDVRQIGGDASFISFADTLRKSPLAVLAPQESGLEILRRGTLSCKSDAGECDFKLLTTQQAVDLATQEDDAAKAGVAD